MKLCLIGILLAAQDQKVSRPEEWTIPEGTRFEITLDSDGTTEAAGLSSRVSVRVEARAIKCDNSGLAKFEGKITYARVESSERGKKAHYTYEGGKITQSEGMGEQFTSESAAQELSKSMEFELSSSGGVRWKGDLVHNSTYRLSVFFTHMATAPLLPETPSASWEDKVLVAHSDSTILRTRVVGSSKFNDLDCIRLEGANEFKEGDLCKVRREAFYSTRHLLFVSHKTHLDYFIDKESIGNATFSVTVLPAK